MNTFPEKILLATDSSEDAALAGRVSADLAKRTGAQLHVVHVWNPDIRRAYEMTLPETLKEWCEQQAARLLAKEVEHIEEAGGKVTEEHLVRGRPVDVILDLCEELDPLLVIMGSRGLGPVRRLLIGSVSEGVVHHAPYPVLVVRGGAWAWPPHRVVIGMDFSEDARAAGELALVIGKHYGTQGVLVRTYPEIVHWTELEQDRRDLYDRLIEDLLASEKRGLEKRAAELGELLGRRPEVEVKVGDAAEAILKAAGDEESTLIAVGSRGFGAIGRARLGSVSTKVLRAARGPVLVYPHVRTGDRGGELAMTCKQRLETYLRENAVPYLSQHHPRAITAQEVAATEHVPGKLFAKTVMVLADEEMVMLALPAPYHVNPQRAAAALGVREVRLAEESHFEDTFSDCELGAMPPFGNLYDVPVYADKTLAEDETIVFRAGTHTDTMSVSYADFERLVEPTVAAFADPPSR